MPVNCIEKWQLEQDFLKSTDFALAASLLLTLRKLTLPEDYCYKYICLMTKQCKIDRNYSSQQQTKVYKKPLLAASGRTLHLSQLNLWPNWLHLVKRCAVAQGCCSLNGEALSLLQHSFRMAVPYKAPWHWIFSDKATAEKVMSWQKSFHPHCWIFLLCFCLSLHCTSRRYPMHISKHRPQRLLTGLGGLVTLSLLYVYTSPWACSPLPPWDNSNFFRSFSCHKDNWKESSWDF